MRKSNQTCFEASFARLRVPKLVFSGGQYKLANATYLDLPALWLFSLHYTSSNADATGHCIVKFVLSTFAYCSRQYAVN